MTSLILQTIGFIAAAVAIGGYFLAAKRGKINLFNWVNFLTSIVLAPLNIYFGSYFGTGLNVAYGAIGAYGILKERNATSLTVS